MRIVIDISPIDKKSKSAHKVRGVGRYISLLVDNLSKFDKKNEYIFTSEPMNLSSVDILHYPYFDPFFITLPYNNKFKTIVTVHDLIPIVHRKAFPAGFKGNIKWQINKKLLKKVDGVITDSEASKKAVVDLVGFDEKKVFPVHLAVNEDFRKKLISNSEKEKLRRKYNLPQSFFLYVGDVTWNKNLPRLIDAIKEVKVPLVMVGKALSEEYDSSHAWNADRAKVEKETKSDLYIKTGYVDDGDLVNIYNMALALLMPSLDEGFGLPVLEAMQSGCPVITSKEGSLPEVGGNAVFYVDSYSKDSIINGLKKMLDKKLRDELSRRGLGQADKFSIENFIKNTVLAYKSV